MRSAPNPHRGCTQAILRAVQGGGPPLVGGLGGDAPQLDPRRTSWKIYRRSINPPSFNPSSIDQTSINHPSIIHQLSINHPSTIRQLSINCHSIIPRSYFYGYLLISIDIYISMEINPRVASAGIAKRHQFATIAALSAIRICDCGVL